VEQDVALPDRGRYATGILFIDNDAQRAAAVENLFEQLTHQANLEVSLFHLSCLSTLPLISLNAVPKPTSYIASDSPATYGTLQMYF